MAIPGAHRCSEAKRQPRPAGGASSAAKSHACGRNDRTGAKTQLSARSTSDIHGAHGDDFEDEQRRRLGTEEIQKDLENLRSSRDRGIRRESYDSGHSGLFSSPLWIQSQAPPALL